MNAINREAWQAALAALEPTTDDEAFTIRELMALFGLKETAMKDRAKKLVESGAATVTRKRTTDVLGRPQFIVAYRLVTKGGADGTDDHRPRRRRHA